MFRSYQNLFILLFYLSYSFLSHLPPPPPPPPLLPPPCPYSSPLPFSPPPPYFSPPPPLFLILLLLLLLLFLLLLLLFILLLFFLLLLLFLFLVLVLVLLTLLCSSFSLAELGIQSRLGFTPLMAAIRYSNPECVQVLLSRGANIMVQDDRRHLNALLWAVEIESLEILKVQYTSYVLCIEVHTLAGVSKLLAPNK